ncbi:MAG: TonB-dependent receptor [Prolixibacteraceae bacterium]|jgi:ferric enterobactin receptor|nr:TonB-dependent receptor [Prolixibacteraceae bacterium]MBT6998796.1 TonB-dependent receptor [Prolixibacteraceae bacterium]MBT7394954.1 TonB-dependent receptor [Prolixibacteraceae bacterium]
MKLKTIKRLSLKKKSKQLLFTLFLFILFIQSPHKVFSQYFQFNFDEQPVSDALVEVAKKLDIRIAFDAGNLKTIKISKSVQSENAESVILSILENTNYTVDFKHNTYLVFLKQENLQTDKRIEKLFSGIVFDKETGEQLPYATIFLWDKNRSLSTTVNGTFSLKLNDSSTVFIQVKYLGYYTLDTLLNTSSSSELLTFGLSKKTQALETIEIMGEKLEMVDFSEDAGHLTFNPARFSDLPNYGETDVFRALQMLPGISAMENSSQLNIRGSSADQNLVMFDGFTLYNLDHFFGVFSALNPNVIKNIQVYRGGFDSRYGERISGIVDITGKSGNQQKPEFYGGINLISANLTTEIPISKKITLVAAGRRAYSDIYSSWLADALLADKIGQNRRFSGANNVIEPKFYFGDFNLKLTYNLNQQENISFSLYGAKDYLNSSNSSKNNQREIETEDINEWGNYGFGMSWKKQWNPKYFTNLQIGHSGYFNDYYNYTVFSGDIQAINPQQESLLQKSNSVTNEENKLIDYFLTFQNKYYLNSQNHLEFGFSTKFNQFEFYKDASQNFVYNNINSSAFLYTFFVQDRILLNDKFVIKPGFRLNYYDQTNKIYFEPRFAASYKTETGVTFKLASGRYYQFLNKSSSEQTYGYNRDFWVLSDGDIHPIVSSNHFIAGASYETKNLFFDLEAYYKTVDGLQEYLFYQNPENRQSEGAPVLLPKSDLSQFIAGNGKAFGIDFLAKYESNNFTSWLAYSISKSTRSFDEINLGEEIPAIYSQTHELKWTNIYTYNQWNFSTLAIYNTGHPFIESSVKDDDFNTTRVYNQLPDYFRIDFSLNYNFYIRNINIKPGLSILNALNTENYLDIYTRSFNIQNEQFNETTLVKAQDLTLNFFVNFRF